MDISAVKTEAIYSFWPLLNILIWTNHMSDGFSLFYLGLSDTDKGSLWWMIDCRVYKAAPLFLLPKCDKSLLTAWVGGWVWMSFQRFSDLYSFTASQHLYSGWLASCERAHTDREDLIPAVILRLSNPESWQNENRLSAGCSITDSWQWLRTQ